MYDLAALGTLFIGLTISLQLGFIKGSNLAANRFLSIVLVLMVLAMASLLSADIGMKTWFTNSNPLPFLFSTATGPLVYFYVLKITRANYKPGYKELLHCCPLLLMPLAMVPGIDKNFHQAIPILQSSAFCSVALYLYLSYRIIPRFQKHPKDTSTERRRHELWRLRRLLANISIVWLLWISYGLVCYWGHYNPLALPAYDLSYLLLAVIVIWLSAIAFSWSQVRLPAPVAPAPVPSPSAALAQKSTWLKSAMKVNLYYQDADLNLSSLAQKLDIHTHELSRIINTDIKKKFSDFINEYRVRDVILKMQDPEYDHITLLGIAFGSGFNSKSTFNRIFKQMTGKSPVEYKADLKKERPTYNSGRQARSGTVILNHENLVKWSSVKLNRIYMFKNYLTIAWRNLIKNKVLSLINIGGLAVGMAVVMLISLWIMDEVSFNKYHSNYNRIAQVIQNVSDNGEVRTALQVPWPLAAELRKSYGSDLRSVVMSTFPQEYILAAGDKNLNEQGSFMEAGGPGLFTLNMLEGRRDALKDPSSILISASTAKAFFGNEDPMGKILKLKLRWDGLDNLKIAGVYADLPENTTLAGMAFIGSWSHYEPFLTGMREPWGPGKVNLYVQLVDNANLDKISLKIRDEILRHLKPLSPKAKPALFLQPMSKWHLYSEFKDGKNTGGEIQYVWLFGIVGVFVLLLACINFMNLSTARSEKRAREVGVRKAIGSSRSQLVYQFYSESLLCVLLAFLVSLLLVELSLSAFSQIAGKQLTIPWNSLAFWSAGIGFSLITAIISGSYPAFYLSSFKPIRVLKGSFRVGRWASAPRKVLVVLQFTVSIVLIIGTIVVIRQIFFAKDRPLGYSQDGLVTVPIRTIELHQHFDAIKQTLISSGTISEMAESDSPPNNVPGTTSGITWPGKDPNLSAGFGQERVTYDYGKSIGWGFSEGRDFSRSFLSDSSAVIINQAAADFMAMKKPMDTYITFFGKQFKIIGVAKDIINRSPYGQVQPMVYFLANEPGGNLLLKINPKMSPDKAISNIASVLKIYNPEQPFEYHFVDQEYAKEFGDEERIGKLATAFASLAIFITCLGLFGMASFMAEQRVKEIGIRKVLGASIFALWQLLSKDFAILVFVSIVIASPVSYYFMHNWLQNYQYHTNITWWIFIITAIGAMLITLLTVSFQAIKAALANPVKSLKAE